MKFIALLIATVSAAEVADFGDCSVADATCVAASCCGTVTGTGAPATTVCATTPTEAEITADAKGTAYTITAAVAADAAADPVVAAADAVMGTFLCTAAAGDAASYMTVGAAAIIAAATLLQ
jgi:hypothetical protein